MVLMKDLIHVLDDSSKPLATRIKISKNAFLSNELHLARKEDTIIKWLCEQLRLESENIEIFNAVSTCLTSEHFNRLKYNELQDDTKEMLFRIFTENLSSETVKIAILICDHQAMQMYIKQNISTLILLLNKIFVVVRDKKELNHILDITLNCFKGASLEILKPFVEFTLPGVYRLKLNFDDIQPRLLDFLHQVLYPAALRTKYKKCIESIIEKKDKSGTECLDMFVNKLVSLYVEEDVEITTAFLEYYFSATIRSFQMDSKTIFQLFTILSHVLQLEKHDINYRTVDKFKFDKSLSLMNAMIRCLKKVDDRNIEFRNGIFFNEYFKNFILSLIEMSVERKKRSIIMYETFELLINLDTNLVESCIENILLFAFYKQKSEAEKIVYSQLIRSLFNMFSKLHREQKFISIILKSLSDVYLKSLEVKSDLSLVQVDDVFPHTVNENLCDVISSLTGKVSFMLFKGIIHFIKDVVNNLDKSHDEKYLTCLKIHTQIVVSYFTSVTMADDVRANTVLIKFLSSLEEFKDILAQFGSKILNIEHNCVVMVCFLSLCYTWGELYIFLNHYKPSTEAQQNISADSSNENYLHGYLSVDQWNTIEQRVANFGEDECKQQLQLILNQVHRILLLNETKYVNVEMIQPLQFRGVIFHKQVINDPTNYNLIAEEIVASILSQQDFTVINCDKIRENRSLIISLINVCLKKINKKLKTIQKQLPEENFTFQTRALIKKLDYTDLTTNAMEVDNIFLGLTEDKKKIDLDSDIEPIPVCLKILQSLPIAYCLDKIRLEIILLSITLHRDFFTSSNEISELSEILLENVLIITSSTKLIQLFKLENIIYHLSNFRNFEKLFRIIMNNVTNKEENLTNLKEVIKKARHLELSIFLIVYSQLFNTLARIKKSKFTTENKKLLLKLRRKMVNTIVEYINEENLKNGVINVGVYGQVLDYVLIKDGNKLLPNLLQYFDRILRNSLSFFDEKQSDFKNMKRQHVEEFLNMVIKNRRKLEQTIPKDFLQQCVFVVHKHLTVNFTQLFNEVRPEQLRPFIDQLIEKTKNSLEQFSKDELSAMFSIWRIIISMRMSASNSEIRQNALEAVLTECLFTLNSNYNSTLCLCILEFLLDLMKSSTSLTPMMVDLVIELMAEVKFDHKPTETKGVFQVQFTTFVSVMELMITFRGIIFISRIQNILLLYRRLLNVLCYNSQASDENSNELVMAKCAHHFHRLNEYLLKHKKDLTRLAPYLIADILQYYEKIIFYPTVKTHLNNCLYGLLSICDSHSNSYLLRTLSSASKEMFKFTVENYNKYHRFTGKS